MSWADIPGIIEGAADGAGLGHDFLRHIDRCRLLIHMVDVSGSEGRDPVEDFETINAELREYSPELAGRKMIVAANKTDILADRTLLDKLKAHVEAQGLRFFELSAAAHMGVRELMKAAGGELAHLPPVITYEPEYVERPPRWTPVTPLPSDTRTMCGSWRALGCKRSWPTSISPTTSPETGLTGCSATPVCLTGWRRWASRTETW